ncbi:hypothetical protein FS749_013832 [Ceratobasidium sp. UAMH 11750]|nr:hypothetical protein FS749_013832 [Ceratobasidium sp. UAMH 11750]
MSAGFRISSGLWDKIHHFAAFPQTGVSLQQMALFGRNPSQGTLLKASQFLSGESFIAPTTDCQCHAWNPRLEELPVRLAHRIRELDELPHQLRDMPSIKKVKYWYAQSFQELIEFPAPRLDKRTKEILNQPPPENTHLPEATANPVMPKLLRAIGPARFGSTQTSGNGNGGKMRIPMQRLYCSAKSSEVWPPEVYEYNKNFTRALEAIKRRHDPTVTTVAQGVLEWKRSRGMIQLDEEIQAWLDRFYMSRIGIRFLIGQHVALNTQESHPDYVGIICTKSNVHDIAHEAIENARFVCEEHYALFNGPPVQLICPPDLHFPYVPGHLSHILFELLKNSLRAVVERYGPEAERNLPPIKVIVVEGREDITIKISDEGGGIPRSSVPLVWGYLFTTMEGQNLDQDFHASDFKAPMAGFGYGLPLSRLYARYFGGDLRLISMEGYGTDRILTDQEDIAPSHGGPREDLNVIRLTFRWGFAGQTKIRTSFPLPKENGPIHEKAAKKGHTGSAGLGSITSIKHQPRSCAFEPDPELDPVVFIFRYAPEDWLQARGIIPDEHSSQKRDRDATPDIIDIDDLETDDDDVMVVKHLVSSLGYIRDLDLTFPRSPPL